MLRKSINTIWNASFKTGNGIEKLGSIVLTAMMLLTVSDIILRRFFNSPLSYSFELVELILVVVAYSYIIFTTTAARHISVDTLTSRFPPSIRKKIRTIGDFITIILFGLIGWQNILQALAVKKLGITSAILHIPKFPFQFWVAFCSILACLFLLFKVLNSLLGDKD